ncbi:ATP-binding protein [Streptomyces xiangluensis]|uniref:ATP-binding protein n=1 Tax=Streptomyces xiangluensis TaxID=2665720 RepID=A0ABV8Z1A5_9ACTN
MRCPVDATGESPFIRGGAGAVGGRVGVVRHRVLPGILGMRHRKDRSLDLQAEAVKRHGDDVLLVVSELVANAIRHGGGVADFRLELRDNCGVVMVSDLSPRPPQDGAPVALSLSGFGWRLVRELASHVQVDRHRHGKTVAATVPLA